MMFLYDYCCAKECCNPENEMHMTCYKCGKCGRKFNDAGVMIDDGGTTSDEDCEWDGEQE